MAYTRLECLAAGKHSKVFKARDVYGNLAAVKMTRADAHDTLQEVQAMSVLMKLPHENVIAYVRTPTQDKTGSMAFQYFEFCEGDLLSVVGVGERGNPTDDETRNFLHGVAVALRHCHEHGVFHFDIKPDNVLLNAEGVVKVADFGSSVICDTSQLTAALSASPGGSSPGLPGIPKLHMPQPLGLWLSPDMHRGTVMYLPPEAFHASYGREEASFTYAGQRDVWSLAIAIYAIRSGYMPWDDARGFDLRFTAWCEAYERNDKPALKDILLDGCGKFVMCVECVELLIRMLHPSPAMRLTMAEVCEDPWLKKMK